MADLCKLAFLDCTAAVFNVDARRFRNSNDDFVNAPALSEVCNSVHIPLKNSNNVSGSGVINVS